MHSILNSSPRSEVFVDKFCFTTPGDDCAAVESSLMPIIHSLGSSPIPGGQVTASGAKYFRKYAYGVTTHTMSGALLSEVRAHGAYAELLAALALLPAYRVTRADITVDVSVEGSDIVPWFYGEARGGHIRLGQRFDPLKDVKHIFAPSFRYPERDTGTVYLGSPKAERRLKVYDKAQEVFDKCSKAELPRTRFEQTLTNKVGLTVRDLYMPAPLYYHHMPDTLLIRPPNCGAWEPSEPLGSYSIARSGRPVTPYARASELLKSLTPTLRAIAKLSKDDPERREAFLELIESRIRRELHGA